MFDFLSDQELAQHKGGAFSKGKDDPAEEEQVVVSHVRISSVNCETFARVLSSINKLKAVDKV
jgi:hypothetical protein